MSGTKIPKSEEDRLFRETVLAFLRSATRHVVVISGELGSYDFPELGAAAHEAVARGVRIDVYASEPRPSIVQTLRASGAHVVVGSIRAHDHFLAVDDERVVVSLKHGKKGPTRPGSREGFTAPKNPAEARGVDEYFRFLQEFANGTPPDELVRQTLERFAEDPEALAGVPVGQDILGILGSPGSAVTEIMSKVADQGRRLGLAPTSPDPRAEMRLRNSLVMLSLYVATAAGMSLPPAQTMTGGCYARTDLERAIRIVRTPVRVVGEPLQNPT
jgi:hypothetical protein